MKRFIKPILLALLSCQLLIAWAQTEDSFPHFTWVTPNHEYENTRFGLVGWLRLTDDDTYHMSPIVPGLGYMGD